MKRIATLFLLSFPCFLQATVYTSVTGGGNWSNSATWSPIGVPGSGDYVTIASAVTLDANESVDNITINSSQTFTVSSSNTLSVYGNFTNNGTFTASTGTVSFVGSSNQSISGAVTFYNLTVNPSSSSISVSLSHAITVSNNLAISNGTLNCQNFQITGNTTGTMTMSSGTTLILGLTSSSTVILFPSNYTVGNITLNPASTVVYQADNTSSGQTVSAVPAYGNLTVTTSKAGTTGSGTTTLVVRGNLTIGSSIIFTQNDGTDSIKGNFTINSGATFNSHATNTYFTGGTFTNSGKYVELGSTFNFNGNTNQYLIGPGQINTEFDELIVKGAALTDTLFVEGSFTTEGASAINIYSTLFEPASSYDTIQATGNVNNGGAFKALNGVVYFNGTSSTATQEISGNGPTLYKVTSKSILEPLVSFTITSDYTLLSGRLNCNSGIIVTIDGNWINNGSTALEFGQIYMAGNQNATIGGTTPTKFVYLYINKSASTDTVKLAINTSFTSAYSWSALVIADGTFDVSPSNYTIADSGSFANDGVFLARNGTVTMDGSHTQNINGTSVTTFYDLTVNNTTTLSLGNNEIVSSNLLLNAGTLDVTTSNYSLTVGGNFTNNAAFTCRSGTVTLNGTSGQTLGGSTSTTFYNLTGASSGSETITLGNSESVSNTFTVNSSASYILAGLSYNLNLAGNFTNNGSLTGSSGTVVMDGGSSQTIGGSNSATFYNLTINPSGSHTTTLGNNQTVSNTLLISTGTLDVSASNYTITEGGNFTNNATFNDRSGTVIMNGSGTQTIGGSTATTFYNLNIAGTGTVSPAYNLTITNNLSISSGTLDVTSSSYNITVGGNFTKTGGTFAAHSNTVTMNGSSSQTLGGSSTIALNILVIGTSGTTTLGGNITATSNVTINSAATLSLSAYTLTLAGNFTDYGTFNCNTSTVYFDDNGKQCISSIHPTETFDNLTVGASSKLGTTCSYLNLDGHVTVYPGGQMACNCL